MDRIDTCPACTSSDLNSWPALIAPFISNYALEGTTDECHLIECNGCGFRFFDLRFDQSESDILYRDYRGARYQRIRQSYERHYTIEKNSQFNSEAEQRNIALSQFLSENGFSSVDTAVVDYGGDNGQCIPDNFTGRKYVFDISGKPTIEGVDRIASKADILRIKPSHVILAHVLEHVAEPILLLNEINSIVPIGSTLYVELPLERPTFKFVVRGPMYRSWVNGVLGKFDFARRIFGVVDLFSRRYFNAVFPLSAPELHEHINFFDERSLAKLLARAGFEVFTIKTERSLIRALATRLGPVDEVDSQIT